MLDNIGNFLLDGLKSLIIGVLLLIVGLLFSPDSWVLFVIKKIKSSVVRKIEEPFIKLVNTIANLYINNNIIDLQENDENFNKKTKYYLEQNEKIDKNIYVIDLCKDIVSTLRFAIPRSGCSEDIYDDVFEYLYHYSKLVVSIDQDKNFGEHMLGKIEEMQKSYDDISKLTSLQNDQKMRDAFFKQRVDMVFNYLKIEKEKLEKLKNQNKDELIRLLKGKMNG
jgi:hypothetical protein